MASLYRVRRLKIGRTEQMDALARAAGALYSQVVVWFWRTKRHEDLWPGAKHLMRWLTSALLHAHSSDAVVQSFFAALASWRVRHKDDPDVKPPHRRKRFYRVQWKATAIRLKDALHKLTTNLVSTLRQRGVQTVVIGDIRNIRKNTNHGHTGNQRLHQMPSGMVRHMLTYKAERLGMQVVLASERYTTQTCPHCGKRYKPKGRVYRCRWCGFVFHRDGVGAIHLRRKYTACGPVVGAMASPIGVRYHAHLRCSTAFP